MKPCKYLDRNSYVPILFDGLGGFPDLGRSNVSQRARGSSGMERPLAAWVDGSLPSCPDYPGEHCKHNREG